MMVRVASTLYVHVHVHVVSFTLIIIHLIITNDPLSRSSILSQMPDALVVEQQSATLLGSPLGNVESTSLSICDKTALLKVYGGEAEIPLYS